jgi:general secretion pathway protein G
MTIRGNTNTATLTRNQGFTLLELLIGVAIIALMMAVAVPAYQDYKLKANIALAKADIVTISGKIDEFWVDHKRYPNDLAEISLNDKTDPWGNAYRYLSIALAGNNDPRQDRNLKPVNTDYDLYSMGADGATHRVFTSKRGRDDVVRANNGEYLGLAGDY